MFEMHLIPMPKVIKEEEKLFSYKTIRVLTEIADERIKKALQKLPLSDTGASMEIQICGTSGEGYTLRMEQEDILLIAEGPAGAFYGIQTLRQIFTHDKIPCLYIEDKPDYSDRGFYHDITRGRVPKVETVKKLIDEMAYYKLNSLQLYIEHTFAFEEMKDSIERTGCLTSEEIQELDNYCYDNFIEFVPSIATFGHLYELLQKESYKELCMLENFEPEYIGLVERHKHHTIDPLNPKSFELIKGLIDQYIILFRSDRFNLCCDETFDLVNGRHQDIGSDRLYLDFVKKLTEYLHSKGKTVQIWGDILLQHPEIIPELPDGIQYLNWHYFADIKEQDIEIFTTMKKPQIVCPSTNSWARFCENVAMEELNICRMAELGQKYGAIGMLNTNWGDYGHLNSLALCMYGLVIGAEKSWSVQTKVEDTFIDNVNHLFYQNNQGVQTLRLLSCLNDHIPWADFCHAYSNTVCEKKLNVAWPDEYRIHKAQKGCHDFIQKLSKDTWEKDEYRIEMLVAAEGIQVMTELFGSLAGYPIERETDTKEWLKKYRKLWLTECKESEIAQIETIFLHMDDLAQKGEKLS